MNMKFVISGILIACVGLGFHTRIVRMCMRTISMIFIWQTL